MSEPFRKMLTNTFSTGDLPMCVMWIAGMSREEFDEWKEFMLLTMRTAERTIIDTPPE